MDSACHRPLCHFNVAVVSDTGNGPYRMGGGGFLISSQAPSQSKSLILHFQSIIGTPLLVKLPH